MKKSNENEKYLNIGMVNNYNNKKDLTILHRRLAHMSYTYFKKLIGNNLCYGVIKMILIIYKLYFAIVV